ncbi:MAG TPA: glycosyltransferase, partial [Firmicutes bacterium]|nr:glycosyltransferase [Bacillota bacterium]
LKLFYLFLDKKRLKNYEQNLGGEFVKVLVNCEDDAQFLGLENCSVVSNGADFPKKKKESKKKKKPFTAGFFGNMRYHPNRDGIKWFLKNVWEADSDDRLVIAGSESREYAGIKGAMATGYLEDLNSEIAVWDVSVVPVRYGTGRQNKILQSWAAGVPVISTSFAAKGVYGEDGKNLLIADTPFEFKRSLERIKKDGSLASGIAGGGKMTLKKYFDWKKSGVIIRGIYSSEFKAARGTKRTAARGKNKTGNKKGRKK